MKCLAAAQIFTALAFGASMFLWSPLALIPITRSMEGKPIYAIHPLFTLQFFLMLSTGTVWLIASTFSLHHVHGRIETLTGIVRRDWFGFLLAVTAVIGVVSGSMFYIETIRFEEVWADDLLSLPGLPLLIPF